MSHPTDDELLLLAYEELPARRAAELESHLSGCAACSAQFSSLEQARVATEWMTPVPRRRVTLWAIGLVAAAAGLAAVVFQRGPEVQERRLRGWSPHQEWSATAGYIAGGRAAVEIDAQLTRLEQGWLYGRP